MRKELFLNGAGIMAIIDNEYCILDEKWDCYKNCTRDEFIEELKKISWVCLTSWSKELKQQYLELVEYTNKIGG